MLIDRMTVIEEARKWIGTRWVHQGRSKAGIDCAGLLVRVLTDLGIPVEDMQGYRRSPDGNAFRDHIRNQTTFEPAPRFGSIALFREARFPTHTGFFGERDGRLTLIHAYMPAGKVIEEVYDHEWPGLLTDVRSIIGLAD